MDVYIPEDIVNYESALRESAIKVMESLGLEPLAGSVQIQLKYFLGSRRTKDLTNLPKSTCDALSGVVYDDDSMIVRATMVKYLDKENPRVEIIVTPCRGLKSYEWPLAERFLGENPDRAKSRRASSVNSAPKPKPKAKRNSRRVYRTKRKKT